MSDPCVLVVEDERRQCAELVRQLETIGGHAIHVATTAHEAIRLTVELRPTVIILDGLLPGMHGFEVARFIRGVDVYKHVRYRNEARLKYGVDAYLVKPVTQQALAEAMYPDPPFLGTAA